MDAWAVGEAAVAALGHTLSQPQLALLEYWRGKPILLVDSDPQNAEVNRSAILGRPGQWSPVVVVQLPAGHDAGMYDSFTINRIIYTQAAQAGVGLTTNA